MLRYLLLGTIFLVTASANSCPYLCVLSPTPKLLQVERGVQDSTKIVQRDSGAFISIDHGPGARDHFGMSIGLAQPGTMIKLMPWSMHTSDPNDGWLLVLLPGELAMSKSLSPDDWLRETEFAGQEEEHLGFWLDRRNEKDPFAAVIISCAERSEDSGNVVYTCMGTKE